MPLKVSDTKPFVTDIPEDTYPSVCVGLFDIGTVHSQQFDKDQAKVLLLFEIPDLPDPEGWPRTVNKEYSQSLDKKSNLFKDLVTWRGMGFGKEELKNFDLKDMLGKPASLLIVHANGKGDRADNVYANIQQISKIPRGTVSPQPSREPIYFDFAEGKAVIPEGTPEFVARKICDAPEWAALKSGRSVQANGASKSAKSGQQAPAEIVDSLNEIGLAWPYTQEELDKVYPPDFGTATYEILSKFSIPF